MDKQEFFLLIPAIIYGVAIVDLMKIFQHKRNYWELIIWGLYIFMAIIFIWTELYQKLHMITSDTKSFFLIIIQAILFAQIVAVITPEQRDINTKEYFLSNKRNFFLLMCLTTAMNVVIQILVFDDHRPSWMRPTSFTLLMICAFYNNRWVRTGIWAFFFVVGLWLIFG